MTDNLSDQGVFRANNLYKVFGPGNTPAGYGTPDVIYAMKAKSVSSLHLSQQGILCTLHAVTCNTLTRWSYAVKLAPCRLAPKAQLSTSSG